MTEFEDHTIDDAAEDWKRDQADLVEKCMLEEDAFLEVQRRAIKRAIPIIRKEITKDIKKELWKWNGKKCTEHDGNIASYGTYRDGCKKCHDKFFTRYVK